VKQIRCARDTFELTDAPMPQVSAPEDVLVRVSWAGLNGLDLLRARSGMTVPPGLEFTGDVVATGSGVDDLSPGEAVMGLVPEGALSEYVVAPRATLIRRPEWLEERVAGAALQMLTISYDAIAQLQPGPDAVALIRGANTMIGNGIIQLLRDSDTTVLGLARTLRPELPQAPHSFETMPEDWVGRVDALFECVGPGRLDEDIRIMRSEGRILLLGGMGDARGDFDYLQVTQKRLALIGSTFNTRPAFEKRDVIARVERDALPKLRTGGFTVPIAAAFDAGSAAEAFRTFSRGASGKIVVSF